MVDQGRFEIARLLIEHTDIPFAQIAAALDFSEASAFTRAFRRWSGTARAPGARAIDNEAAVKLLERLTQ